MVKKDNVTTSEWMITSGLLVGPLFIGVSLVIALFSAHFDLTKHEVSLLLVGPLGWLQMINFIVTGLLAVALAVGLRRSLRGRASTWGPVLLGVYGVLLVLAGFFHPDPQLGYPAGAPDGIPSPASAHANVHSSAFSFLALAIVINGFVFARRYAKQSRRWATYCYVNSIALLVLVFVGGALMPQGKGGLPLLVVAILISTWVSMIALKSKHDARGSIGGGSNMAA